MSKMFEFITQTWNPIGGECSIRCSYCWARRLIKKFGIKKYEGEPFISTTEILHRRFKEEDFVFVSDMRDLLDPLVPSWMIEVVLNRIHISPATFLLLTKHPRRYLEFELPKNCVCGATIETDLDQNDDRFISMCQLVYTRKMVAIEPIMKFSPNFIHRLRLIRPEFVAVGYDNYNNCLDEPKREITEILIEGLELSGIKVYRKTIRDPSPK